MIARTHSNYFGRARPRTSPRGTWHQPHVDVATQSAPFSPMVPALGTDLDGWQVIRELGRGGMATVYLAKDVKHNRHVALKILRAELQLSSAVERFLREIQITARLAHPHILPLIDSGTA